MIRTNTLPFDLPKKPTIQDVARQAGVSTATVSRVLANRDGVSEKTRQKVYEAVRALNYQINRTASNLRKNTVLKIGVIITDIQNPFFSTVVRGIEKITIAEDYTLILGNSDEDSLQENKLITMLLEEGVAGIIFAPVNSTCESYEKLTRASMPFVIIDRMIAGCDADRVLVDCYTGAAQAVERLIELGHQRIAFIGGFEHLSVMQERQNGYLDTLRKNHFSIPGEYVRHANNRQDGGYVETKSLLKLEPPPTAILVANNLMTLGSLQAIHEEGIKIPEQISLIGFDDMDWAPSLQPPLSVVAQPAFDMGVQAANALLQRIREPALPAQHIVLQTKLIMRRSCQSLPERNRTR